MRQIEKASAGLIFQLKEKNKMQQKRFFNTEHKKLNKEFRGNDQQWLMSVLLPVMKKC